MCDPADFSHERPERVFTTPAVMPNVSDLRDRVVYWVEHDTLPADREDYHYLVRYFDNALGKRACEVRTESDLGVSTALDLDPDEDRESVTGSPVLLAGSPRSVLSLGYEGPLTRWDVLPSGLPASGTGGVVDLSPWPPPVPPDPGEPNIRGGDTSMLVDPITQSIVWGNKCTSERVVNGEPCDVEEWGRVNITSLLAPVPAVEGTTAVPLDAWVSMAPSALSHDAGASGSDLLFAIGTEISVTEVVGPSGLAEHKEPTCDGLVTPLNPEYDCALTTFLWNGTELMEADHWDAEREFGGGENTSCCIIPPAPGSLAPPVLANGWVGEPVPILDGTVIYAAKAHGEIYRFDVDPVYGSLTLDDKVRFAAPGDDDSDPLVAPRYRIPPEQSPVIGRYPSDPTNFELLVMVNDVTEDRSKYLIMDVDAWTGDPMADPAPWVELQTEHRVAGWAPGAAARSVNAQGPIYDALTFVVAVGADVPVDGVTSTLCPEGVGAPPRLYFLTKTAGSVSTWTVAFVDLVHGSTATERVCYEMRTETSEDEFGNPIVDILYDPIDVTAGVAIQGAMVYVATSNGVFWEYDTNDPNAVIHLAGYSGPWPRFRRNNFGMAQP